MSGQSLFKKTLVRHEVHPETKGIPTLYESQRNIPKGYQIVMEFVQDVKEGHVHVGVLEPKPLPTLLETVGAFFEERGAPNSWMNPIEILVDVYAAYQREKENN
ncbi:hypothetical protein LCGC14_1013750 [marine sediment metagenome]|uniref:Uncharacterized protein n=1 Tax=marine sediment metagenome TaxID=412755 RepID=A0A0F9NL09_9ZZZZ